MKSSLFSAPVKMLGGLLALALVLSASAAFAEQGGQAPGGHGSSSDMRQHGEDMRQGQQSGGVKGLEESVLRDNKSATDTHGGKPESTGGTAAVMGRLNMARAYLSPGFDPAKIDDPEAPLANLDAYKTAVEDATGVPPVSVDINTLAAYLANVATAPISGASINKLNDMLNVTLPSYIDASELAALVNQLVKENREEE